ncbi:LexA family protein [Gellertiella hungarica]|uniref:Transcriptional regulator with XRE-family HTH domain n=1 Tax=Gellertiella hungarica TaxID=1572859 RepID=A0A7W6J8L7_9HYPH|nr:helix-turn-helix domain-containing protein [Gellertiella hungarica]MBB4066784.1 transcriptional regulator with XRE-family HTH domain [Gellertiella hungarica]
MYDNPKCADFYDVRKSDMRDEVYRIYLDWIRKGLKSSGKTQTALAAHLGVAHPQITMLMHGKRNLKVHEIPKIAEFLGVPPPSVELQPYSATQVPIRKAGIVEAGAFREVDEFDQSEPEEEYGYPDPRYPNARQMFFEVSGDSMDDLRPAPILPGAKIFCVAYEDIAHRITPQQGMVVVVERTRDGGHFREWSVKQIEMYEDRIEFHPRSTNPKHKPIIVRSDAEADNGTRIEIIALVRRIVNDVPEMF